MTHPTTLRAWLSAAAMLPALLAAQMAIAQGSPGSPSTSGQRTFGTIADDLTGQVTEFGNLVGVIGMLVGLAMLVMSAVKFRAYSTNPNDPNASLAGSVGWLIAGAALVALPEFLGVGIRSLFGVSATGGGFTSPVKIN